MCHFSVLAIEKTVSVVVTVHVVFQCNECLCVYVHSVIQYNVCVFVWVCAPLGHHQQYHQSQHDVHQDLTEVWSVGRQQSQHSLWAGLFY